MTDIYGKAKKKMESEGMPDLVIKNFLRMLKDVETGVTGNIREEEIEAVEHLTKYEDIKKYEETGIKNINKLVYFKLNGGLGTSMGLDKAKSLIEVKKGMTFLDVATKHILKTEEKYKIKMPLVLMNSFSTEHETKEHMKKHSNLEVWHLGQFKHPKIKKENLHPSEHEEEHLNWNPPGHGDLYFAIVNSNLLDELINKGYEYIFVSNGDNLGATIDFSILGFIVDKNISFLMEVADRTPADRKGGHLSRYKKNKNLMLRESAQCHEEDTDKFQDITKHKFFNTNSLWINLKKLKEVLEKHEFVLPLPMIRNQKNVNPKDELSEEVYQLETAMGSAIELFDESDALVVPKSRFAPVKKCSDLLALWSDIYVLTDDYQMVISSERKHPPIKIVLDEKYYKLFDDFKERFEKIPSLIDCKTLTVEGDVKFGENIVLKGDIKIKNNSNKQVLIENKTIEDKELLFD